MEKINSWIKTFQDIKENNIHDIIMAMLVIIIFIMISSFFSYLIMRIFKLKEKVDIKKSPIYKALKRIFLCLGVYIALLILNLQENILFIAIKVIRILVIWNVAIIIANLIAPDSKLIKAIHNSNKIDEDDRIVKLLTRFGKIGIFVIAVYMIITELDYDISGLVTGLRINKCCNCTCSPRSCRKYN